MFLVTARISLASRVSCAASRLALICRPSSSPSFLLLSFSSPPTLPKLARRLTPLALLSFSFLTLAPANFAFPHPLCLCNKINDHAAIGLLFFNFLIHPTPTQIQLKREQSISELTINLDHTILKNQKHSPFLVRSPEGPRGNRPGGVGRLVYCGEGGMGTSRPAQTSKRPINPHAPNHPVPFGWALRAI